MTQAVDVANDAHRVWAARLEVLKRLRARLVKIHTELDDVDNYARSNQGQVMHPPQSDRSAEDVLLDKVATEAAISVAESRAAEAKKDWDSKDAIFRSQK